jgi:putative acetyltransferase
MHIRRERPSDYDAVFKIHEAAFESLTEPKLVEALRRATADLVSLVAEDEGEIIGHILFSPVTLTSAAGPRVVALAPMAVIPDRQRQGVGSALVRAGLDECRSRQVSAVAVVGHPDYYPRFGFVRASAFGIRCEFEVPDEAWMIIELVPGALESARGGTVVFHDAFKA